MHIKRIVDMLTELMRFTVLRALHAAQLVDHNSERKKAGVAIDPATDLSAITTTLQAARS